MDLEISFGVANLKIPPRNVTPSSIQLMEIYLTTCGMEDKPMHGNLDLLAAKSKQKLEHI